MPAHRFLSRTYPSTTSPDHAIRLRVRRLRDDDRSLVQGFDFGPDRYQRDVGRFIQRWIWDDPPRPVDARTNTLLGLDATSERLVGYGTWTHVEAFGDQSIERHIEIAWFGVDVEFQGRQDDDGRSLAGMLYATVEEDARRHPGSRQDMPFTLTCHVDNERGLAFWKRRGYGVIPDPKLQIEDEIYYRMVR